MSIYFYDHSAFTGDVTCPNCGEDFTLKDVDWGDLTVCQSENGPFSTEWGVYCDECNEEVPLLIEGNVSFNIEVLDTDRLAALSRIRALGTKELLDLACTCPGDECIVHPE